MITFLFKEFLSFFKRSIPSGISITNRHLLILDGHESHVTFEAIIEQAQEFRLDMIILPLHTFHALSPWMWLVSSLSKLLSKGKRHSNG
jgi:hypothetical protein